MRVHFVYLLGVTISEDFSRVEPLFCFSLFFPLADMRKERAHLSTECESEHTIITTKIKEHQSSTLKTADHYEVELRCHLDSSSPVFTFLISLVDNINHRERHGIKGRLPADRKMDLLKVKVKTPVSDWSKVQFCIYCIILVWFFFF